MRLCVGERLYVGKWLMGEMYSAALIPCIVYCSMWWLGSVNEEACVGLLLCEMGGFVSVLVVG